VRHVEAGPWVIDCTACVLAGEPLIHLGEAEHLAGVHDHLHHRGNPTAIVRPLSTSDADETYYSPL
jgi:hypothetical protein